MLDRRFGLDFTFQDAPQNKAQLMIVQQMCQGLTMFEPRVTFSGIQFSPDLASPGVMNVLLAVSIDQSELILPSS
jgi:phage baseplate assembly protein W